MEALIAFLALCAFLTMVDRPRKKPTFQLCSPPPWEEANEIPNYMPHKWNRDVLYYKYDYVFHNGKLWESQQWDVYGIAPKKKYSKEELLEYNNRFNKD